MDNRLTFGEAARYLAVCPRKITEYCHRGLLPYPDPKTITFKREDLDLLKQKLADTSKEDD